MLQLLHQCRLFKFEGVFYEEIAKGRFNTHKSNCPPNLSRLSSISSIGSAYADFCTKTRRSLFVSTHYKRAPHFV